jgi:hypothetical protein
MANNLDARRLRTGLFFGFFAVLLWLALQAARPRAHWLTVEGPDVAPVGSALRIRVCLAAAEASGYLDFDLHGATSRREPRGYLAGAGARQLDSARTNFEFAIPVPDRPGVTYLHGIVYLSPTGRWGDRTRVAETEIIPVVRNSPVTEERRSVRWGVYAPESVVPKVAADRSGVRGVTSGLFALAGGWIGRSVIRSRASDRSRGLSRGQAWLVVACLVACVWEAFGLGAWTIHHLRLAARFHGLYGWREGPQRVATVAAVTLAFGLGFRLARSGTPPSLRWVGFAWVAWLGLASVGTLSLHAVDQLAGWTPLGVPMFQLARLGAALVAASAGALHGLASPSSDR